MTREDDSLLGRINVLSGAIFSCCIVCMCGPLLDRTFPVVSQGIKQQQEERAKGQIMVRATIRSGRIVFIEAMCLLTGVR